MTSDQSARLATTPKTTKGAAACGADALLPGDITGVDEIVLSSGIDDRRDLGRWAAHDDRPARQSPGRAHTPIEESPMSVILENEYSYASELIAQAAALPDGVFIEVDDLVFRLNRMDRKIAQTLQANIDGRTVSMAYIAGERGICDLVLSRDRPFVLGTYAELLERHAGARDRLVQACAGQAPFTPHEMVTALVGMTRRGMTDEYEAAAWARSHARRSRWLVRNRLDAIAAAPVQWASIGL
jgi:hypothetical protein